MVTNKKLVSTRISDEDYSALQIICERKKTNVYDFLAELIGKETGKVRGINLDSFPTIGENKFEYDPETDSYIWIINFGTNKPLIIADNLGHFFVENIKNAIQEGVIKRNDILKKIKRNQSYIPSSISKFRKN